MFVVARADADPALVAQADQLAPAVANRNGDDAVAVRKGDDVLVDVIGQIGFDPGTRWGIGDVSTADNTIRRPSSSTTTEPPRITRQRPQHPVRLVHREPEVVALCRRLGCVDPQPSRWATARSTISPMMRTSSKSLGV